jgi:hypothetical protein
MATLITTHTHSQILTHKAQNPLATASDDHQHCSLYRHIFVIFNDATSSLHYIASNDRMNNEL